MSLMEKWKLRRQIRLARNKLCEYLNIPNTASDVDIQLFYISSYEDTPDQQLEKLHDKWRYLVLKLQRMR